MKVIKVAMALLAAFLIAPLFVQAQLLKCVSKDGKVEYATQCPTGTKELQTGIKSPKEGPAPAKKEPSIAEKDAEFRKRQTEQQAAATKKAEEAKDAEARKQNCDNARAHLVGLESGERVVKIDPTTGERSYLDDNERKKAVAQARHAVDSWCK